MKRSLLKLVIAFSLGILLLPISGYAAQEVKVGPSLHNELATAGAGEKIPVIVRMKNPLTVQAFATPSRKKGPVRTQARANLIHALKTRAEQSRQPLQKLLNRHGISKSRQLWLINGMAFQATPAQIDELARMPEVMSIVLDQVIELPKIITSQASGPAESNIDQIRAPDLWALGYAGQGVTVAIMDSGVDSTHPDLAPRWRGGSNSWYNAIAENCSDPLVDCVTICDTNTSSPCDYTDSIGVAHGTGVAGVLVGGDAGGTAIGVAPESQWIAAKIFDSTDQTSSSVIHLGFQWLMDPDDNPNTDDAPDIVNNSWGFENSPNFCDTLSKEFQPDVQAMRAAGIAVLFAAGNTGPDASSSIAPANYPESFAVGSVDSSSLISSFSARGPSACDGTLYPEMVAPGSLVKTSNLMLVGQIEGSYSFVSGTSFAAPQVSGVMALLLSAFPGASVAAIETALMQSATDLGPVGADNTYGFGLVDSLAAFNYLSGQQAIAVTDSISPETDHLVAFANVYLGLNPSATVSVSNNGSLPVQLDIIDVGNVSPPFSITSDGCSNLLLQASDNCSIEIQFAPTTVGNYNGSLDIISNTVGSELVTINLTGSGIVPYFLAPTATLLMATFNGEALVDGNLPGQTRLTVAGDELAVFDPDGVLCGRSLVSVDGEFGPLVVYGNNPDTPEVDEGAIEGDSLTVRFWDSLRQKELPVRTLQPNGTRQALLWSDGGGTTVTLQGLAQQHIGVFRPGNTRWYADADGNGTWGGLDFFLNGFGISTDQVAAGDWNGDGLLDPGAFRNVNGLGYWYFDSNGNGVWDSGIDQKLQFGYGTDIPVVGDWNGDGQSDFGVFRNIDGIGYWYFDSNGNRAWDPGIDQKLQFGVGTDIPVVGDWNGDGQSDFGVFRNINGLGWWYFDSDGDRLWNGSIDQKLQFGLATDLPVAGDWNGDGLSDFGVMRNGVWYLDSNGNRQWDSGVDMIYPSFGLPGDKPLGGVWR